MQYIMPDEAERKYTMKGQSKQPTGKKKPSPAKRIGGSYMSRRLIKDASVSAGTTRGQGSPKKK